MPIPSMFSPSRSHRKSHHAPGIAYAAEPARKEPSRSPCSPKDLVLACFRGRRSEAGEPAAPLVPPRPPSRNSSNSRESEASTASVARASENDAAAVCGGGLVAQRAKQLRGAAPRKEPEFRAAAPARRRSLVAERAAALRGPEKAPAAPAPRRKSSGLERLRRRSGSRPCARCGLDVFAMELATRGKDAWHRDCLRCGHCARPLEGVEFAALAGDDVPYCHQPSLGRSCFTKVNTAHLRHAKEAADQRPGAGEVSLARAARLRAVAVVGEELEKLVGALAPRCARCGGCLGAKDRIVIQGMVKMHELCLAGPDGEPAPGPPLPPARALKDAPLRAVVKLAVGAGTATFFLERVTRDDDEPGDHVAYRPDGAARAPPARRVADVDGLAGAKVRCVSMQGVDLAPPAAAQRESPAQLLAPFEWNAQGLDWKFHARFALDLLTKKVSLAGALLTVEPAVAV